MRSRPLATAAAAALLIGAAAGPAAARSTVAAPEPAAGTATSALNLLSLALAGHNVMVGGVALTSDTVNAAVAKVVVTPVSVDGTSYGEQTVTPANSPASVPTVSSSAVVPAALGALASVQSPVFDVQTSTANGASSSVAADSLGAVSVLGLPIQLAGTVDVSSVVTNASAVSGKEVTVSNLALPSIADILGALGLDLSALPIKTLTDLLTGLNLTNTAVDTAKKALADASAAIQVQINAAQAEVDKAAAALSAKTKELQAETAKLPAAEAAVTSALAALAPFAAAVTAAEADKVAADAQLAAANAALTSATAAVNALVTPLVSFNDVLALGGPQAVAYNSAVAQVAAATTAVASATAAVTAAKNAAASAQNTADLAAAALAALKSTVATLQGLVNSLQKTLDDLIRILNGILSGVQTQIDALLGAVVALLDGTPLVSIDSISIQTEALTTSDVAGGQSAKVVGGELTGLKVAGTDVLQNVLGTTSVELLDLVGTTLTGVTNTINGLTGTLSSVLSNVPTFPTLSIPAPQIGLLTKSTSTSIADGFGLAENSVKALSVTIPAITLPAGLALPNAQNLPAVSGLPIVGGVVTQVGAVVGDLVSKPITLSLGTLSEQSRFRPATVAAPGTSPTSPTGANPPGTAPGGSLPTTGLSTTVALLAAILVGAGLAMRRRLADGAEI